MPVPPIATANRDSARHIHCGEQRRDAMPL
jgi:hypothetical protein